MQLISPTQAKRDSETRLMEKLEKERALVHELTTARSSEEAQSAILRQQLRETEEALAEAHRSNDSLKEEVGEKKRQNEELEDKLAKQASEMNHLHEIQENLMSQIAEKYDEVEQQVAKFDELREKYEQETEALRAENEMYQQEAAVAQQNIAEILGAKQEGVTVQATPLNDSQEPPTLSVTQVNMVDKSAYEALQQAYENIEDLYGKCREENRDWRVRFVDMRSKHDAMAAKNAEMEQRVVKCREEYETKCAELAESKRTLRGGGSGSNSLTDLAALQNRVREMEDNQRQVTQSWEIATKELALRKEELKKKAQSIAELEEKTFELVQLLDSTRNEFREFQDKHDAVVNEKTARMDQMEASIAKKTVEIAELQAAVASMSKEKGKLEHTVQQLREQLESLKRQAHSSERACPVCNTKFPGRISQTDFEKHVQGHFTQSTIHLILSHVSLIAVFIFNSVQAQSIDLHAELRILVPLRKFKVLGTQTGAYALPNEYHTNMNTQ